MLKRKTRDPRHEQKVELSWEIQLSPTKWGMDPRISAVRKKTHHASPQCKSLPAQETSLLSALLFTLKLACRRPKGHQKLGRVHVHTHAAFPTWWLSSEMTWALQFRSNCFGFLKEFRKQQQQATSSCVGRLPKQYPSRKSSQKHLDTSPCEPSAVFEQWTCISTT